MNRTDQYTIRFRAYSVTVIPCVLLLSIVTAQEVHAQAFTYDPPGTLEPGSGTGRVDDRIYVPGIRFPIEKAPAFSNSQVYRKGGYLGPAGGQCDSDNYAYPWRDNYCETRSRSTSMCPTGKGHQGQDIRPATCTDSVHWAVAAEDGTISRTRGWVVSLVGDATDIKHNYLHLNPNQLQVSVGQRVKRGDRIGPVSNYFGSTPTTIHLHYELRSGSTPLPTYTSLVSSYKSLLGDDPDSTPTTARAITASGSDFDGDGLDDIFWYRQDRATDYIWYSTGRNFERVSRNVGGRFTPISGDYNGDGKTDIFWYRAGSDPDYIWYSQGRRFTSKRTQLLGTYTPISGDFDGNGYDDIFWYRPGTGVDYVWYSNGTSFDSKKVTVNGSYTPVAGDFDGDGTDDIFWYRPTKDLVDYVWYGEGTSFVRATPQVSGSYEPVSGDFNGDGRTDIFWYGPGASADFVATSTGRAFSWSAKNAVPIAGQYRPIKGNFDGDAYDDIFWYRPGTGADWIYFGTPSQSFQPLRKNVTADFIPVP